MTASEFQTLLLAWIGAITVVGSALTLMIFKFLPIIQQIISDVGYHGGAIKALSDQVNTPQALPPSSAPSAGVPPHYNTP